MVYAEYLKTLFPDIKLKPEDLFCLEPYQIKYLRNRVPKPEFAALLKAHPVIHRYFIAMCPSIKEFINDVLKEKNNNKTVDENCSDLLWEIADLIVYNKYPDIYNAHVEFAWNIDEIIQADLLKGKIAVDAGAGPGKLAFMLAHFAETVFAVEPAYGFRQFIKKKAKIENVKNLFAVDGFLDSIPLPDNFADILITSQAIGWNLQAELREIERVVKQNGYAIHLFKNINVDDEAVKQIHNVLTSQEWKYECTRYQKASGSNLKYHKNIIVKN